jgi:sulfate/thiosulfate import ATP-binding protein cysA
MLGDENLEKFFSKIDVAEFGISAGSKLASKNHKLAGSARDGSGDKPLKSQGGAEFCGGQSYSNGSQQAEILKFNAKPPFDAEKVRLDTEQAHLKFNVRPSQAGLGAHPPQAQFNAERAQAKIENFMRDLLQNYVLCVSGAEFAFAEIEAYFTGADRNTYKRTSRAGEIFFHNFGFDISFRSIPQSGGGILVRSLRVLSGAELLAGGLPDSTGCLPGSAGNLHGSAESGQLGSVIATLIQNGDFIAGPRKCMGKILNLQTRNLSFSLKHAPKIARAAGFSNRIRRGEIVNEANLDANMPSGAADAAKLANEPRRLTSEEFEVYLSTDCAAAKTYKKSLQRYES